MSQSLWESEVVAQAQSEPSASERSAEERPAAAPTEAPAAEPGVLALSMDDFSALEERILRAVNGLKRERATRAAAEAQLREQAPMTECLQQEVSALRAERDQVRQRVERLLEQLDALEL